MAGQESGGVGSVLKIGLLAGAAWLVYDNFFKSAPAAAAAPAPAGSVAVSDLSSAAAGSAPAAVNPGTLVSQLQAAAAPDTNLVNGQMNAWRWNFYLNILRPPGVPDAQFAAAFPDAAGLITAAQFIAALQAQGGGLSGIGNVSIPVPVMVNSGGRKVVVWASRDLAGSNKSKNEMRAAMFQGSNPFVVRPRALPALQKVEKS